ncbi:putative HVA22-like protein g [Elaeis guineensis]|uniref:HVA22-like protein n=1 Tax=Elaeis guineensis var. tenera TaxID=51953 RepID=A0A6I9SC40_ELAGV|nr:putative HVA22-like protein g isoform X1 [Elaeis guineensis]
MMGSFLTGAFVMILGYAYPAYECYKTVELNKPEIAQLRFWCQYWILVAVMTVFERVGDTFISWLPMYSEAKLAFFVYLWYPKTRGTAYVYGTFFRPYMVKHETEIDRNLLELRTRAGDILVLYWQKAWSYGQTRVFEILNYVASQSQAPRTRPVQLQQQQQQQSQQIHQSPSAAPARQPAAVQQPQQPARAPPSPSKNQQQKQRTKAGGLSPAASPAKARASSAPSRAASGTASHPSPSKDELMLVDTATEDLNPPSQETALKEAIPMTPGRLKKRAAIAR